MIFPRKLLRCFFKLRLVEGEVDLHPGGFSVVVAVCGKGVRVGLWHDLAGSVFNEDALGPAILDRSGSVAVALLHEIARSGARFKPTPGGGRRNTFALTPARWRLSLFYPPLITGTSGRFRLGNTSQRVAHPRPLGFEVFLIVRIGGQAERELLDDFEAIAFEADDFLGVVRQQPHLADAEVAKDLRAHAVVAQVGSVAEFLVGLDGVETLLL